jgi:hypothetical protein
MEPSEKSFRENFTGDIEYPFFGEKTDCDWCDPKIYDCSTPGGIDWKDLLSELEPEIFSYHKKIIKNKKYYDMSLYIIKNPEILGTQKTNRNKKEILEQLDAFIKIATHFV